MKDPNEKGVGAAMLDVPACESPLRGKCSVVAAVVPDNGMDDQPADGLESRASVG
jgi:hypothetical protein